MHEIITRIRVSVFVEWQQSVEIERERLHRMHLARILIEREISNEFFGKQHGNNIQSL